MQWGGGIPLITPQELINHYQDSVVIIGSKLYESEMYSQLLELGYPKKRILNTGTQFYEFDIIGTDYKWQIPHLNDIYLNHDTVESIVIFGTGLSGRNVLNLIKQSMYADKKLLFCDENPSNFNNSIDDVEVISPKELKEKHRKSIVIIADKLKCANIFESLVVGGYPYSRILYPKGIKNIRFPFILTGKTGWQYFDYFKPRENEIFVDVGCYDGNNSLDFANWAKNYEKIYAFEASQNLIISCQRTLQNLNSTTLIPKGLWNRTETLKFLDDGSTCPMVNSVGNVSINVCSLDDELNLEKVTFIKMDIEGAEFNALLGAEKTIKKWNPRLAISVYHKPEDILEIPILLLNINPDYKFALRQYDSAGFDTVLYAY